MNDYDKRGAGGTPGGLIEFFIGSVMILVGGWLFLSRIVVTTSGFGFGFGFGGTNYQINNFGVALIPLMIGIGLLFFNGKNFFGWVLTVGGFLIIIVGILINLRIYFEPTNLITTIIILGTVAGGIGLVARALQPH
ncbi:MAG: hypothetical protein AAFV93_22085 [Chloroflexota bacterium]